MELCSSAEGLTRRSISRSSTSELICGADLRLDSVLLADWTSRVSGIITTLPSARNATLFNHFRESARNNEMGKVSGLESRWPDPGGHRAVSYYIYIQV